MGGLIDSISGRVYRDRFPGVSAEFRNGAASRGSQRIAVEVVMTGPLQKEVSNLRKDLEAGFERVIFAVESEEVRERLGNLISREVSESEDRVEVRLLREFG